MDEGFEEKIKSALADPDIMQKVSGVLQSLGGNNDRSSAMPASPALSGIASSLSGGGDDRTRLLLALKPFLSEKRAPYMDSAINILRLVSIGKIGKELNLF